MRWHLGQAVPQLGYERVPVRLRAFLDGELALDTQHGALVWEPRRIVPMYAVPEGDLLVRIEPTDPPLQPPDLEELPHILGPESFEPHTTPGTTVDLVTDTRRVARAGFLPDDRDLAGLVVLDFRALDRWLAEDEELVGHPHDPFKRIDVLSCHRHIEVSLDGDVLASTDNAMSLLETYLPIRYYIPPDDVASSLLTPSETRSTCAYKGIASYLSTTDGRPEGRDIGWTYPARSRTRSGCVTTSRSGTSASTCRSTASCSVDRSRRGHHGPSRCRRTPSASSSAEGRRDRSRGCG